jgi:hypothetical protein
LLLIALLAGACAPADSEGEPSEQGDDEASEPADAADDDVASETDPDAATGSSTQANDAGARTVDASARDAATSARDAANEPDARRDRPQSRDAGERDGAAMGSPSAPGDAGSPNTNCTGRGNVTYSLARAVAPSAEQNATYMRITRAMDTAVEKYNCYTDLSRALRVVYEPSVATADGNVNGNIRFGAQASMNFVTAMHEIGHTFGVGSNEFKAKSGDGRFNGPLSTAEIRRITGKADEFVHTDGTHFWPLGLNYETEYKSEADAVGHCQMVVAIRKDLGQ